MTPMDGDEVIDVLRNLAAALRVFGQTKEDHEASFAIDRAAKIATNRYLDEAIFYPDKKWVDYLEAWRLIVNPAPKPPEQP